MPIYKTEGTVIVPVSNQINASNEEEAFNAFEQQLSQIIENLDNYMIEEDCEYVIENIEKVKETYTSLKSLQRQVTQTYTSLKDLYNK